MLLAEFIAIACKQRTWAFKLALQSVLACSLLANLSEGIYLTPYQGKYDTGTTDSLPAHLRHNGRRTKHSDALSGGARPGRAFLFLLENNSANGGIVMTAPELALVSVTIIILGFLLGLIADYLPPG